MAKNNHSKKTKTTDSSFARKSMERKFLFKHLPICLVIFLFSSNIYHAYLVSAAKSKDIVTNLLDALNGIFSFRGFSKGAVFFSIVMILGYWILIIYIDASKQNTRPGEEYGGSRKGKIYEEAYPLNALNNPDPKKQNEFANLILSKNIQIDIDTRHTRLNNNIFVVGGSGSGKTRFFVKPNILQMYCNYVVIDPKGSVAVETGKAFEDEGYDVKYLNFVDMEKSMGYNPFVYFKKPTDVQMFVKNLIDNTSDTNKSGGDEFFVKSEMTWLTAIIFLVMSECAGTELMNMNTVLMLLDHSEAREEEGADDYMSEVDQLFADLEKANRQEHGGRSEYTYRDLAIKNYKIFKLAAGVVSLKRLLNQLILKSWSSKMIKKSLEAYFFTLKNKIVFCKNSKYVRILFRQ